MGNYVLTLTQVRCPDGAELAISPSDEEPEVEPRPVKGTALYGYVHDGECREWIQYRTERRAEYRRRLETPDDLIVTHFINAVPTVEKDGSLDCGRLIEFIGEYGFPDGYSSAVLFAILEAQSWYSKIWEFYRSGNIAEAVNAFRRHMPEAVDTFRADLDSPLAGAAMTPDIEFRSGKPTLLLPTISLNSFMLMETALVITGGSQVMRCAECATVFVTGSGTGRRGTSRYCSNRCRVAAQRSRKVNAESSVDDLTDDEKLQRIAQSVRGAVTE
jgi:hypothetical protein